MSSERDALVDEAMMAVEVLASIRRRSFCEQPLYRGVSLLHIHILMGLQEQGARTVSQLANLLSISMPSASSIVDRMEEHDLVRRERDSFDRRVVHVEISEHGRAVIDGMLGMHRDKVKRLLATMADEELDHVVQALRAVRRAVDGFDDGAPSTDELGGGMMRAGT